MSASVSTIEAHESADEALMRLLLDSPDRPMSSRDFERVSDAWIERKREIYEATLASHATNLVWQILGEGNKDYVFRTLLETIATAKSHKELNAHLWAYSTVVYHQDDEGGAWADLPQDGYMSMREWCRINSYETCVGTSKVTVEQVMQETDVLKRLAAAFRAECFRVVAHKSLAWKAEKFSVYTVNLELQFWPNGVPSTA
jgi:hypothetical protein